MASTKMIFLIFFKDKNLISSLFLLLVFNIFHTFFTASIAEFE